jgi:hypothetical protein
MYDAGALWIAAKYQIPLLFVMHKNRAYCNDWNHQIVIAPTRGTDMSRAHIGMDLFGSAPDFALARAMGWRAEGPDRERGLSPSGAEAGGTTGHAGPPGAGGRGDATPLRPKWRGRGIRLTPRGSAPSPRDYKGIIAARPYTGIPPETIIHTAIL